MTDDAIRRELERLRGSVDALTGGLNLMLDTLEQHSSMLKALMLAAAPEDDGSPLREALERIALAVEQQNTVLLRIEHRLPAAGGGASAP